MIEVTKKLFYNVVIVPENWRALVLVDGKFDQILEPGRHKVSSFRRSVKIESFNITASPDFKSAFTQALLSTRPDLAQAHFTIVQTTGDEVALISFEGKLVYVVKPENRLVLWQDAGQWQVETINVSGELEVPHKLSVRLATLSSVDAVRRVVVEQGQVGLLYVDSVYSRLLQTGVYAFWQVGHNIAVRIVEVRETALDVAGQEILTRDKVSVRVNLAARYRVVDPVLAVSAVKDFVDALYRAMQHAFRQSLASKTLDELLSRKGEVDGEASAQVRADMASIGLEVADIAIKDVILPGDMRDILNRVVTAEKEAEAQVIRRREETNATRSLLNTARVMAENPVMLRLKELEALEKIADKVQALTVHGGTQGLLDLVSLQAADAPAKRRTTK